MVIVTREDSAALGYCNKGMRAYFTAHCISWQEFIREGLPVVAFEHVKNDPMAARLIAHAEARHGR